LFVFFNILKHFLRKGFSSNFNNKYKIQNWAVKSIYILISKVRLTINVNVLCFPYLASFHSIGLIFSFFSN
jgi:hypothetical protein